MRANLILGGEKVPDLHLAAHMNAIHVHVVKLSFMPSPASLSCTSCPVSPTPEAFAVDARVRQERCKRHLAEADVAQFWSSRGRRCVP